MFSIVSAIRVTDERKKTLNAKIIISNMPTARLNWKAAKYRFPKFAGFEGAGKEIPVEGTGASVRDVKKFTKLSHRLSDR